MDPMYTAPAPMPSGRKPEPNAWQRLGRGWQTLIATLLVLLVIVLLFDWNWLRHPLENYISKKTERTFRISNLDVDLGFTPTIKVKDVYFENAEWSRSGKPMAQIGSLEFSISLRDLWNDRKILVPRVAMSQADLLLEKTTDGRKNWVLREPTEQDAPSRFRIGSLAVDQGRLRYADAGEMFEINIDASTMKPIIGTKSVDDKVDNDRYTMRYAFKGKYRDAGFNGNAFTGDVLSFQETGVTFPIRGDLVAGNTRASVEGTIADVRTLSAIDVRLRIAGRTLANLYPFLLLPLPASPPYELRGRLVREGNRFGIDDLAGRIGSTDMAGSAAYVQQQPRPLLTTKLRSKLLNIADLGPIIGLETKDTDPGTKEQVAPRPEETSTRERAQAKERENAGERVLPTRQVAAKGDGILPSGKFEGGRLKAIDAEVDYSAQDVKVPDGLPVDHMKFSFRLHDGVARLQPLEFGFAGGRIVSDVTIDARNEQALRTLFQLDFRNVQIAQLFPDMPNIAKGGGIIGAHAKLSGVGNSIADAAANANGTVSATVHNGRISNLLDALAGLNGGKVISLWLRGDKEIAINCGALAFDVKDGIGQSQFFVVDTEQTRVDGRGSFSLKDETFAVTIEPKPKRPGILSLRTPVHLSGTFRHPEFGIDKGKLALRAGSAVALALVNPFAMLVPLIETGPGEDANCLRGLAPGAGAKSPAGTASTAQATPRAASPAASAKSAVGPAAGPTTAPAAATPETAPNHPGQGGTPK